MKHLTLFLLLGLLTITPLLTITGWADENASIPSTSEAITDEARAEATTAANQAVKNAKAFEDLARGLQKFQPGWEERVSNLPEGIRATIPDGATTPQQPASRLLVFLTLSMPDAALKGWLRDTEAAGGHAMIRGFHGGKLSTALARLTELRDSPGDFEGGLRIDPTAFKRLDVQIAPTVVVLKEPLPLCESERCETEPIPDADRLGGNTSLAFALRRIARDGDVAPDVASDHLARLEGGTQ